MKREAYVGILMLISVLFLSGCQSSIYMKDMAAIEASKIVAEEPASTPEPTPEPAEKEYSREERNQLTNNYKAKWQTADRQLRTLDMSEDSNGVKRYSDANVLQKIEIGQDTYGTQDLEYAREYFFDNGMLYFARLTQGDIEMRFYFHEEQLLRWIDGDNNAYDNREAHHEFKTYGISLLAEANKLFEEFEAEQVILNSYVD